MSTTWVITGANRGIGRALAELVLARPNHRLFALVRDPSHETSRSLLTHTAAAVNSSATLVQYDAAHPETAAASAYEELRTTHGVAAVDVVVANAGALGPAGSSVDIPAAAFLEVLTANTLGPIALFNAMLPLMRGCIDTGTGAGAGAPKFVVISSAVGSTTLIPQRPHLTKTLPYGTSKAALNHAVCKMDKDYADVAFEVLTPGPTRTGFGGAAVDWSKIAGAMDVEPVAEGLMQRIDEVKKTVPGEGLVFKDWKGDVVPW